MQITLQVSPLSQSNTLCVTKVTQQLHTYGWQLIAKISLTLAQTTELTLSWVFLMDLLRTHLLLPITHSTFAFLSAKEHYTQKMPPQTKPNTQRVRV